MNKTHTFHIPVMGTGFSVDTPIKVAKYGIASVISLVDDFLIEQVRKLYSQKYGEPYTPIGNDEPDCRARRITAYLDLVDKIVQKEFAALKASPFEPGSEITKYFELLPETSPLKGLYRTTQKTTDIQIRAELQNNLRELMEPGDINVNIMTKLDRTNYDKDGKPLPAEFSDAMAALRGFAKSHIKSAIEFSAGLNQRLYNYASEFKDFYADATGGIRKKIVLKVSDYRSALIQGKIFAKKGLWVSEYRIESSLNCGGHAFATPGHLLGPILAEFKTKRKEFLTALHEIYNTASQLRRKIPFVKPQPVKITVQGGIGTADEDKFIREYYGADATGWGTPFLLCPEATNVDPETMKRLSEAEEKDLYLSDVSPLGIPFNNLRQSLSDEEKKRRTESGKPGSACPLGHLAFSTEFTERPLCTASRAYQFLKLQELEKKNLPPGEYQTEYRRITEKSCICHDLGEGVYINNNGQFPDGSHFPAVCPGPNMAYFNRVVSLKEMVDHIYGRTNVLSAKYRPHVFVKELQVYIEYLIQESKKYLPKVDERQKQYFTDFKNNLLEGIAYYHELFSQKSQISDDYRRRILAEMDRLEQQLRDFISQNPALFLSPPVASS